MFYLLFYSLNDKMAIENVSINLLLSFITHAMKLMVHGHLRMNPFELWTQLS